MFDFFFYGTLRDPELCGIVLGREIEEANLVPATLAGYRRICVVGTSYPALIADPRGRVDGCFVGGLDAAAAARVSYYESDDYGTVQVIAETANGPARAWIFVPLRAMRLAPRPWDYALWRRRFRGRACASARVSMAALQRPELKRLSGGWRSRQRLPGVAQD